MMRWTCRLMLIALPLLLVLAGLARRYHRFYAAGTSPYSFHAPVSPSDVLTFRPAGHLRFLEAHFSNHAVLRYAWKPEGAATQPPVRWRDAAGRMQTLPVVTIAMAGDAASSVTLPLARDYVAHIGSLPSGLRLAHVRADAGLQDLQLTNYPRRRAPRSGASALALATEFRLQDIAQPTPIDSAHVQTWEFLCPSRDGRHVALSSVSGDLYYLNSANGTRIWTFRIPDGRLDTVVLGDDDGRVYVGEHSADGNVYGLDARTGRLLWKYATAGDIGSFRDSLPESSSWSASIKPQARDVIWRRNSLFVRSRRSRITIKNGKRAKSVISKVYAFHPATGRIQWTYPASGALEGYQTSSLNVSADGRYASLVLFDAAQKANPRILVLDAATGRILWTYQCDTIPRHFRISTCYEGLAFSPDSRFASAVLNDGRIFLFDNPASVRTQRGVIHALVPLITPITAGNVPVTTFPAKQTFTRNNTLIVSTGQTYATPLASVDEAPIHHPDANSVFGINMQGELLWKTPSSGYPAMLDAVSHNGREYVAIAYSHNVRTRAIGDHGFALIDLNKAGGYSAKLRARYNTGGICVHARFSQDLSRLFVIEAVVDMDPTIRRDDRGQHRMLIFDLHHD